MVVGYLYTLFTSIKKELKVSNELLNEEVSKTAEKDLLIESMKLERNKLQKKIKTLQKKIKKLQKK